MTVRPPKFRGMARALAPALLLAMLPLGACDDTRSTINDPDLPPIGPDAEFIFGTTVFATGVYRLQNDVIEKAVRVIETGQPLPVSFPASAGTGTMRFSADTIPGRIRVDFVNYVDSDLEPIFALIEGRLIIHVERTAPGLEFTINPDDGPFLTFGPGPNAMLITLIQNFGDGSTVTVSGITHGELVNADTAGLRGIVDETGTMRLEDPSQGFMIVQSLETEFEYDGRVDGSFARYPAGKVETAFFQGGASPPFDIEFDGFGGATYPYRGRVCESNLTDHQNGDSCSGL